MQNMTMVVIGLVGGVASGKSFVASCFEELGASILDADKIGHEVLQQAEVISAICTQWPGVRLVDGQIDRASLAQIVFDESNELSLEKLESITHPIIGKRIEERLRMLSSAGRKATVLDASVLIKAGLQGQCDKIVFVNVDLETRKKRAACRGWSDDELKKRERFQTPVKQKRKFATDVLDNFGSPEETRKQVLDLWNQWGLGDTQANSDNQSSFNQNIS